MANYHSLFFSVSPPSPSTPLNCTIMQRALASRPSAARPVARRGAVVARAGATTAPVSNKKKESGGGGGWRLPSSLHPSREGVRGVDGTRRPPAWRAQGPACCFAGMHRRTDPGNPPPTPRQIGRTQLTKPRSGDKKKKRGPLFVFVVLGTRLLAPSRWGIVEVRSPSSPAET